MTNMGVVQKKAGQRNSPDFQNERISGINVPSLLAIQAINGPAALMMSSNNERVLPRPPRDECPQHAPVEKFSGPPGIFL